MPDIQPIEPVIATIDDATLVAQAKRQRGGFEPLYIRYFDRVFAYCLRRLGNHDDAADATSVIFARALESLMTCRDESFRSWLFAIAHNVLADIYRNQHYDQALDGSSPIPDRGQSPEDWAIAQESAQIMADLLARLPIDQRHVLELRLAGLSSKEIGRVLGKQPNAIDQAQYRAVRRLRELVATSAVAMEGLK